jgi:hypothetical protein
MTNIQEEVLAFMQKIQALGYAVAVFTPEELRDANPKSVEHEMISAGFNEIEYLLEE